MRRHVIAGAVRFFHPPTSTTSSAVTIVHCSTGWDCARNIIARRRHVSTVPTSNLGAEIKVLTAIRRTNWERGCNAEESSSAARHLSLERTSRPYPTSPILHPISVESAFHTVISPCNSRTNNPWSSAWQRWALQRRHYSDRQRHDNTPIPPQDPPPPTHNRDPALTPPAPPPLHSSGGSKHLLPRLPHLHRPTKEELLSAATGFWRRLTIRFKWLTIRSARPFNSDEIGAFVSWIFWGHVLWIAIGTTTFVSLVIWFVNTVFAQETLAGWVGNYLTHSSGVTVVFESAIVPAWRDGVITFNHVFVSRRPRKEGEGRGKRRRGEGGVSKGSSSAAAAEAARAERMGRDDYADAFLSSFSTAPDGDENVYHNPANDYTPAPAPAPAPPSSSEDQPIDDGNYTQFDLTIDSVAVTLSFSQWFNGRGLLRSVSVRGVRGVIDRSHVLPPAPNTPPPDPKSFLHERRTGDFELNAFRMDDVLLTMQQPGGFRKFMISVFTCELSRLRKQWLFYDFLSAEHMSGSFDNSLFTIHPRQVQDGILLGGFDAQQEQWKKQSRLRIDGLNIDHLNRGVEGPFGWIYEGWVDVVADVLIPLDNDVGFAKTVADLIGRVEGAVTNHGNGGSNGGSAGAVDTDSTTIRHDDEELDFQNLAEDESQQEQEQLQHQQVAADSQTTIPSASMTTSPQVPAPQQSDRPVLLDISIHLNSVRARVPLFPRDVSYVNATLIRPIVAYINAQNRTFIPVTCRVVKLRSEFDGSWTVFDSGLLGDVSREVYGAFARDVGDESNRRRRIGVVGWWGVRVAVRALALGLAGGWA